MTVQNYRWVRGNAVLFVLLFSNIPVQAGELKVQRISINSTPAGAEVNTISGRRGITPLTITERDIYPNTYADEKLDMYGKVILSKRDCETVTRTVTLDDVKQGIDIKLDCIESAPAVSRPATVKKKTVKKSRQPAAPVAELISDKTDSADQADRRLRQLKVLDELLEDKLISVEEERAIRKRIYERINQ